jgi:hypothetical protein
MRNVWEVLIGIPGWKGPLGISRCRREANIGLNVRNVGWEGVDLMYVA